MLKTDVMVGFPKITSSSPDVQDRLSQSPSNIISHDDQDNDDPINDRHYRRHRRRRRRRRHHHHHHHHHPFVSEPDLINVAYSNRFAKTG